ncbi:hypothetical protein JOF56_001472 [Kibdelosporangium banguiense]|uniref:Uncharacterized protein n=1 Tax=Kibdelosporangium banguiense TaxID=1365924 RepID=A0ABS4T9J4_9PSEU|nr:hypothetical protein [Kibdelosporangium banguiense]MBP2321087.1 hypothetical protein [Kibdelosporangium banguiense]
MIRRPVSIGVAALLLLAGCSSTPPAPSPEPASDDQPVEQVKAEPLTPERLQSLWWSWANSADPSPVADPTGQYCGDSQPFGVWLVAGTNGGTADRHCQVPATLPIAGPAIGHIAPDAAACTKFLTAAKGEALLDDKPVQLEKAEPTKISYDTGGGSKEGFSCGLWVRLQPLSPGEHTLTLRGSSGSQTSEANYDLTVVRLP